MPQISREIHRTMPEALTATFDLDKNDPDNPQNIVFWVMTRDGKIKTTKNTLACQQMLAEHLNNYHYEDLKNA